MGCQGSFLSHCDPYYNPYFTPTFMESPEPYSCCILILQGLGDCSSTEMHSSASKCHYSRGGGLRVFAFLGPPQNSVSRKTHWFQRLKPCLPKPYLRHVSGNWNRRFTKGWFPKGWFWWMFPRNENRNEGMFALSPGTKTSTRVHSHVPPERKPERGHICQHRPFRKPPSYLSAIGGGQTCNN